MFKIYNRMLFAIISCIRYNKLDYIFRQKSLKNSIEMTSKLKAFLVSTLWIVLVSL